MTDIVERLRDPAFAHDRDGDLPLRLEAAAEIERLQYWLRQNVIDAERIINNPKDWPRG